MADQADKGRSIVHMIIGTTVGLSVAIILSPHFPFDLRHSMQLK